MALNSSPSDCNPSSSMTQLHTYSDRRLQNDSALDQSRANATPNSAGVS